MLNGTIDGLFRNNFDQGRHHGLGSSLFIPFDRSCGSIFNRTFGLDGRGIGGRLGDVGTIGRIARSTGLLIGLSHGRQRVMKDVEGC